jgi:S1-C subfamily serine protease
MDENETSPTTGSVPEGAADPAPIPAPEHGAASSEVPPVAPARRRTPVVVAVVATAALTLAGAGIGYAAGANRGGTTTSGAQGATSSQQFPGYGSQFGSQGSTEDGSGSSGNQFDGGQFGGSFGGQLPTAPDGSGSSGTTSTDTSSKASGSQLIGLVRIVSTMKYADGKAAGTGMVLTSDGEVITNHHVVEGATTVKVTVMSTGKTYTAKVVGTDPTADVAVLQLQDASGLKTITTDTDSVATGDKVTAVGDGNGTVDYLSAATGQVMATNQEITTQSDGTASGESLKGLIEISSDVVSGYSGGATYDSEGEVLGMTTAASSGSSDVVGYAIPIATVLEVADDLEAGVQSSAYSYGYPAFLGIGLSDGTAPTVAQVYSGTPAAKAGITAGDTITEVGGTAVSTATQLQTAIASHEAGDAVSITWKDADGASHTATITLVQGPVK